MAAIFAKMPFFTDLPLGPAGPRCERVNIIMAGMKAGVRSQTLHRSPTTVVLLQVYGPFKKYDEDILCLVATGWLQAGC